MKIMILRKLATIYIVLFVFSSWSFGQQEVELIRGFNGDPQSYVGSDHIGIVTDFEIYEIRYQNPSGNDRVDIRLPRGGGVIEQYNNNGFGIRWDDEIPNFCLLIVSVNGQPLGTFNSFFFHDERPILKDVKVSNTTPCFNDQISIDGTLEKGHSQHPEGAIYFSLKNNSTNTSIFLGQEQVNDFGAFSFSFRPSDYANIDVTENTSFDIITQYYSDFYNLVIKRGEIQVISIAPSAPIINLSDIEFKEKIVSRTVKNTTFSIYSFYYNGKTYTYDGSDIENDWPPEKRFTAVAVSINPLWNFLGDNSEITNWNSLINIPVHTYDNNINFETLNIQFEDILYNDDPNLPDPCAFNGYFPFPKAQILDANNIRPTCSDSNNGSISISDTKAAPDISPHFPQIEAEKYTLYKCKFDSDDKLITTSLEYVAELDGNNGTITFEDIESGEYIVRLEISPFTIEKYVDLRATEMTMSYQTPESPSCHGGNNGSVQITALSYNGTDHTSTFNRDIPTNIEFRVGNTTITNTDFQLPITLTGTTDVPLTFGSHNISFSSGSCSSTIYPIAIPIKLQNTLTLGFNPPTCHDGVDGKINIETITHDGETYTSDSDNQPTSLIFNVFESDADNADIYNTTGVIDIILSETISWEESKPLTSQTWYVSYIEGTCVSERVEVEIDNTTNSEIKLALAPENSIVDLTSCTDDNGEINVVTSEGSQDGSITYGITGDNGYNLTISGESFDDNSVNNYKFNNNLPAGNYSIVVNDFCNESATLNDIIINPAPKPILNEDNVSITPSTCFNSTDGAFYVNRFEYNSNTYDGSLIDGTPNFEFTFTQGASVNTQNPNTLPYTINNCTGGDSWSIQIEETTSGCSSETALNFNIPQPDELQITQNITSVQCYDDGNITLTADVSGGSESYNFLWKDINDEILGNEQSVELFEGQAFLELTDSEGCAFGRTEKGLGPVPEIFITNRPEKLELRINNSQDADYPGASTGSVTLESTGGWLYHSYSMNGTDFQNQPLFNGLAIGIYNFYVRDNEGCQTHLTTSIGEAAPLIINTNYSKDVNCFNGADGQIAITVTGGVKPYSFELTDQFGTSEQPDSVFNNLSEGTYSVRVSYNTYQEEITGIVIGQPDVALNAQITDYKDAKCGVNNGWAEVLANGGIAPYSYEWGLLSTNQTSARAVDLPLGTHEVKVTDANNCVDFASVLLFDEEGPLLEIDTVIGVDCSYSLSGGSASLNVSGGKEPYIVSWPEISQSGLLVSDLTPGNYTAIVTDANNCSFTLSNIFIPSPPQLLINFDDFKDPSCYNGQNGELYVSASGGTTPYVFSWVDYPEAGNTGFINNLSAGRYTVNLNDANNCLVTDSMELKNPGEIIIDLADSVFLCSGQTATLDAGNTGMLYQWTSNTGFESQNRVVELQDEGDYTITITNVNGCSSSKQLHIKYENRLLEGGFLMTSQATMSDTIVLIEISWPIPDSVQWTIPEDFIRLVDGESYKELIPLETGEYTIGMKAYLSGCSEMIEKQITIIPGENLKTVNEQKQELITKAKLFPNPNSGVFELEIKLSELSNIRVDLFSMKGMKMIPTKYETGKKDYLIGFNLVKLDPGIYFINIIVQKEMKKLKFIVN